MDSCKGLKRFFEVESCSPGNNEGSQNKTNRVEAERQRTALEGTEDDFEEFVALLDRIQYMKAKHLNFSISKEILIPEDLDVKVTKTKSLPCLPSFEWEDFRVPAQKDICSFDKKYNPSGSEEKGKQGIRPANYLKTDSSSDAYDRCPAGSFDLNVESSSKHMNSLGL